MLNLLYFLIGLCVLGLVVIIVYAKQVPTDNSVVAVADRSALSWKVCLILRPCSRWKCLCAIPGSRIVPLLML